jgi:PAS domain-containing protein
VPEATTPGVRFEDAVQAATYKLPVPLAAPGREDFFLKTAIDLHRSNGGVAEYRVGRDRWLRGQSRRTKSGGTVTNLVDITEVKRREREARQARAVLQSVFDNMSDGVLLYEADGRWVYQNPAMARLHDMSDELLGTLPTFADIVHYRALRGDYGPIEQMPGGLEGWIQSRVDRFTSADQPAERRRTTTGRTVEVTYRGWPTSRVLTIHRDLTEIVEQEERPEGGARRIGEDARDSAERARQHDRRRDAGRPRLRCRFVNRQVNEFLQLEPGARRTPAPRATTSSRFQAKRGDFGPLGDSANRGPGRPQAPHAAAGRPALLSGGTVIGAHRRVHSGRSPDG